MQAVLVGCFVFGGAEVGVQIGWFDFLRQSSLCGPGWPRTQRSRFLCLLITETKGVLYHVWLWVVFFCQLGTSHSPLEREKKLLLRKCFREMGQVCGTSCKVIGVGHSSPQWVEPPLSKC